MSDFERHAIQRLIDKANALGIAVPEGISADTAFSASYPARAWAELYPADERVPCCDGAAHAADLCTCWRPIYDTGQAVPCWPQTPDGIEIRNALCGDCAYRKGSPERSTDYEEEALLELAQSGTPFWCHDGMRRPSRWEHPDGRSLPGDPDDWQPAILRGIPFRADGRPAMLCAGWAARVAGRRPGA